MCPTGYEKSPFLSKADVSKKYRTIECGITREMLLIKSQILSLPCLDLQEIQSLKETVPTPYREFKILFPVSLGPGFIVGKKAKNGVKQRKKSASEASREVDAGFPVPRFPFGSPVFPPFSLTAEPGLPSVCWPVWAVLRLIYIRLVMKLMKLTEACNLVDFKCYRKQGSYFPKMRDWTFKIQ